MTREFDESLDQLRENIKGIAKFYAILFGMTVIGFIVLYTVIL